MNRLYSIIVFLSMLSLITSINAIAQTPACQVSGVTTFVVDLSSKADTFYQSPDVNRSGIACGASNPERCIQFIVTTHPDTKQINFDILTTPKPPAKDYYINCGQATPYGTPVCLVGPGPHCVIFCKQGNDKTIYGLTAISGAVAPANLSVTSSCNRNMTVNTSNFSSIVWKSITDKNGNPTNDVYNSFLTCTSNCVNTTFNAPPVGDPLYPTVGYVDFQVTVNFPPTPCDPAPVPYIAVIRMMVIPKATVTISPPTQSICAENLTTTITANALNGTPPYSYLWSNGATTQSIAVGAGNYTVTVSDVNTSATCSPAISASIDVAKNTGPNTATPGGPITICNGNTASLNGSVISYNSLGQPVVNTTSGGTWSGGTGSYNPDANTPNAIYTPSIAERSAGTATLTLTTTNNGNCPVGTATKTITIDPLPVISAGPAQSVCKNNNIATLSGSALNTTSVLWASPTGGTFSDASLLNPTYTPSANDLTTGSVILTLTGTAAVCANVSSTMTITYTDIPVVNAGNDISYCSENPQVQLAGSVIGSGSNGPFGGIWSLGAGTFAPNNTTLNAIYTLSNGEVDAIAGLQLTSTNNGNCLPVTDIVSFNATPKPVVDPGPNLSVCRNNPSIIVTGTVTAPFAGTPAWSSSSGGTFTAVSFNAGTGVATATYNLSASDLTTGSASIRLAAQVIGGACVDVFATKLITVTEPPTVSAGAAQTSCHNNPNITLAGFSNAGATTWTGGTGTFNPNNTTLNAVYTPSLAERNAGTVTLTLTSVLSNCAPVPSNVTFTIVPSPTVFAGAAKTSCANNATVSLGDATSSTGSGAWSGGTGTYLPSANDLNPIYTPSAAEISAGTVTLTLTTSNNGTCLPVTSTVTITINPLPVINSSAVTICADNPNASISASFTNPPTGTTGVIWSGGAGSFNPNNISLNTIYTPNAAEIASGSITLTATSTNNGLCNAVTVQTIITIAPTPTVSAGSDQELCGNVASANLTGTINGATGGTWTTSGTGTFGNASALVTTYSPTIADKNAGVITLTLTSTGNGTCNPVSAQMLLTFTAVPTITAGPNQSVCANDFPIQLNGSGTPAAWVNGAGTFSPDRNSMNATYTPTAGEVGAGTVTLTLTTNPSGACPQISSTVTFSLSQAPLASIIPIGPICGNAVNFTISGSVNNPIATGGVWSTNGTGTIGNTTTLPSTTYTPSPADKAAGSVVFTLTTTGTGACSATSVNSTVIISPTVTVFAGPPQQLCNIAAPPVNLNGVVTGATDGTWSSNGSGTLTNATSAASATYTPNPADGAVTFTLITTGNPAGCPALSSTVDITFIAPPTISAGPNQTVCADIASVTLAGTASSPGALWTTTGSGSFSPNNTTLNAQYITDPTELGAITFTLTSTGSGPCASVNSQMTLTVTPQTTINAGPPITVCANNPVATLTGSVTQATGGTWTSAGDGVFSAISPDGLSATYTPGATDISNGIVNLTLTSTGMINNCNPVVSGTTIIINPPPTVNAGPDRTVCANNANVKVIGSSTVASTGTWTTLGSGSFSNVSTNGLDSATYTPSLGDITATTVTLRLTSGLDPSGLCLPVSQDMIITITPPPTVEAGPNQIICADSFFVNVDADTIPVSIAGIWTSSGTGSFFPSPIFDAAMYVPTAADRTAALGGTPIRLTYTTTSQGSCSPVSDFLDLSITAAPTIQVGVDQTICATGTFINITSTKTVATGTRWTTSGSGTFGDNLSDNTTYTPSAIDKTAGSVVLTSTTNAGLGTCNSVADQMTLTIVPMATVNLGPAITVCADLIGPGIPLTPVITNSLNRTWSTSGTGIFNINNTTQNVSYVPSSADTTAGTVTVSLLANGNAPCGNISGSKVINFTPTPSLDAGLDQTVCNGSNVSLNGIVVNATGGNWTTSGTGNFSPNSTSLNALYVPSIADTTSGNVTLTLTTAGSGSCASASDQMQIFFNRKPQVNPGLGQSLCLDEDTVHLNGFTINAAGAIWTSNGTGTFYSMDGSGTMVPDNTTPTGAYAITPADRANGQVIFTLTTNGNSPCAEVSRNMTVNFRPLPIVNVGPDISVCDLDASANLGVTMTNITAGIWTTNGDGNFGGFPTSTSTNPTYTYGPTDKSNPSLHLIFTSTAGNGACNQVDDTLFISFFNILSVDAGPPSRTVCTTDLPITLTGSGSAGVWSTSGDGTFANANLLSTTYTPGAADIAFPGTVTLTLTPAGTCVGAPDNIVITIIAGPTISAGVSRDICTDVTSITMNGASSSGTAVWSTSGTGTFNNNSINAIYTLVPADITSGSLLLTYTIPTDGICNAIQDTMTVTIHPIPFVSAGSDKSSCANPLTTRNLEGSHTIAPSVQWTKITNPGFGTLLNATSDTATYTPDPSDVAFGTILFQIEIPAVSKGFCAANYTDIMQFIITPAPTVNIGVADTTICEDQVVPLSATTTVATGGTWSTTNGTGAFTPSTNIKNVTYTPSTADIPLNNITITYTTTGNGNCVAATANKIVRFVPLPIVNAGIDFGICTGNTSTALTGSFSGAPGIVWRTSGTGNFDPDEFTLNALYFPSQQDKDNGGVTLSLENSGVAACNIVTDFLVLTIFPSPSATVFAGANQLICKDNDYAQLNGVITVATTAKWDCQGAPCLGAFFPNDTDLEAKYYPAPSEKPGSLTLRLTTIGGNGICTPEMDEMLLTIMDTVTVDAGSDNTYCADIAGIPLTGTITHATLNPPGYSWVTTGTGVFSPNEFASNPIYTPTAADTASGLISFTLTSTNNGTCNARSDFNNITLTKAPTANAGSDFTGCANKSIALVGSHTVASTSLWTTTGSGSFTSVSANGLNATYNLSPADTTAGTVILRLTNIAGFGTCNPAQDQVVISIDHAPIARAGIDRTMCADGTISLDGKIINAGGGIWSTLGSGTFSPDIITLNSTYTPSQADTAAHSVSLILTSSSNGLCLPEDDTITIDLEPNPLVNAGNVSICRIIDGAGLSGIVLNGIGGEWNTTGSGVFSLNSFDLSGTYYPSNSDLTAKTITLYLNTIDDYCGVVTDSTVLSMSPTPLANAGTDQFACSGAPITLSASIDTNAVRYEWRDFNGTVIPPDTTSISVTPVANTFYILTVYDSKGCPSDRDTLNVNVFNMPNAGDLAISGTRCFTDSNSIVVTITDNPPSPPLPTFQWLKDGVIISGESSAQINPTAPGQYQFVYSFGGCTTPSIVFDVFESPEMTGVDKINCMNTPTTLPVSSVSGGTSFSYAWAPDPTITSTDLTQSSIDILVPVPPGNNFDTIPYNVTITNNFNCSVNDNVYFISIARPNFNIINDTLCENETVTLVAVDNVNFNTGGAPPIDDYLPTYGWTLNGSNLNNTTNTQFVDTEGRYIIEAHIGECIHTDTSDILYNKSPIVSLPPETKFCISVDKAVTIDATAQAQSGFSFSYDWSITNDTTPIITTDIEGYHVVNIASTIGSSTCSTSDTTLIRSACPPRVFVPNTFTPGKETNQTFKVYGTNYTDMNIIIFNRWGEVIFSSDDKDFMQNVGWDGSYKNVPMPIGVYTYILYYDGESLDYKGPYKKEGDILILK